MKSRIARSKASSEREQTRLSFSSEVDAGLNQSLLDLIRLRVCQMHHCTIGAKRHSMDLKAKGEKQARLAQLATWQQSTLFDEKERAALALCEAISLDPNGPLYQQLLDEAMRYFSREQIISLTLAIMATTDWNYEPAHPKEKPHG